MIRFIVELGIFFAIFALSLLPLKRVSSIVRRRFNQNKWLLGAGITALITASVGWTSRSLQRDCLSEYNDGCVDAGGAGTQFVLVAGFVIYALANAYLVYND